MATQCAGSKGGWAKKGLAINLVQKLVPANTVASLLLQETSCHSCILDPQSVIQLRQYVTRSAKTRHNRAFSNSILLQFYNLTTQMYMLAKFQLRILKAFEVTALQSNSNRKVDLYSKYRENKLQALTKTNVTYEWSDTQA